MSISIPDREELIALRLAHAEEAFLDAEVLIKSGSLRGAANRVYYAMYHAVGALSIVEESPHRTHRGLIGFFHREFIASGRLEKRHGRALQKAFDDRSEADYEDLFEPAPEQLTCRLHEARALIDAARAYLATLR